MLKVTRQKIKVILSFTTMQCFTFTLFLTTVAMIKGEINIYTILLFLLGVFGSRISYDSFTYQSYLYEARRLWDATQRRNQVSSKD